MTRAALRDDFLRAHGWGAAPMSPVAGDASLRSFWRLSWNSQTRILMDAPPPHEATGPFVHVAGLLAARQVSVPRIDAEDAANGFVLMEDLGDALFPRLLDARGAKELYALAVDALVALHQQAPITDLPPFDDATAIAQAERVTEWLWPAWHGGPAPEAALDEYRAAWRAILPSWRGVTESVVHFDYMIDNLILLPERPGPRACGWLDFQDALYGPTSFDLMSLLQDVRRDLPPGLEAAMVARYVTAFPALDAAAFRASYAVGGAQRNARILGTFVRLWRRDGKPAYLRHLPRVWSCLERNLAQPALRPLARWFDRHFPAAQRRAALPGAPA